MEENNKKVEFQEGSLKKLTERYSSPSSDKMGEWFKESFDRKGVYEEKGTTSRVIKSPTLDELANALMSGKKVSVTYVYSISETVHKVSLVHIPGDPWKASMPNIAVNESGERSYIMEVKEHFKTVEMYVSQLKTNMWDIANGYGKQNDLPTWTAHLFSKHSDTKGYSSYSWEEKLTLVFDGKEVFVQLKDDIKDN